MTFEAVNLDRLLAVCQGAYADIYHGRGTMPTTVYKIMRVVSHDVESRAQLNAMINNLCVQHEQIGSVEHSHVSPILMVDASIAGIPVPTIKMQWFRNGNVGAYLSRNVGVDKTALVTDIAYGLANLHSLHIIHGNLYPGNVLITDDHRACIADAGVYVSIMQILHPDRLLVPLQWPYKSPEELATGTRTFQTDVYSFACTVYFIYAGKPIFNNNARNPATRNMLKIMDRGHLEILSSSKPPQMSEALWDLLARCWSVNPMSRPMMAEVLEELRAFA